MPGFYVPELTTADKLIQISGSEFHHLVHVRRLQSGDKITITNGNGLLASAIIKVISKKIAEIEIIEIEKILQSMPRIAVAFSLLKSKNDQMIIEKLTELGVKEFFPIITERSVRKSSVNTAEKFEKTAIAAIKQCDNAYLPVIHEPLDLKSAIIIIKNSGFTPVVALETGNRESLSSVVKQLYKADPCLIIGPEGGFSPEEIQLFEADNMATVTIGNHILRAETAAIAVAAQTIGFYLMDDPDYY